MVRFAHYFPSRWPFVLGAAYRPKFREVTRSKLMAPDQMVLGMADLRVVP